MAGTMRDDTRVSDADLAADIVLEGVRSVFEDVGVPYAVVFGSYASGSESPTSDLDICVRFADECSRRERFRQRNRTDSALQSYGGPFVDVSDLGTLADTVALNALRDGIVVYGDATMKAADERLLERHIDESGGQRRRRRRDFIDQLAEGNV